MAAYDETRHALNFEGFFTETNIKILEEPPYGRLGRRLCLLPMDPAMRRIVPIVTGIVGIVALSIGGGN